MDTGLDIPSVARSARSTVAGLLLQQLRLNPGRIAVDDGRRRLTYAAFVGRVRRLAGMLARKGYPAGLAFRVVRDALAVTTSRSRTRTRSSFLPWVPL